MSKLCSIGDHSVISDQPDVDDVYEDEDYDPRNDRDEVFTDHSSASQGSVSCLSLLFLPLAWILH